MREEALCVRYAETHPELPPLPDGPGWRWLANVRGQIWYRAPDTNEWRADAYRFVDPSNGQALDSAEAKRRDPHGHVRLASFGTGRATHVL